MKKLMFATIFLLSFNQARSETIFGSAGQDFKERAERVDTLYRPNLYQEGEGLPKKVEIIKSKKVRWLAALLGYDENENNWSQVRKALMDADMRKDVDPKEEIITFEKAINGSSICWGMGISLYTMMVNYGLDAKYVEILKGAFKESGDTDSLVVFKTGFFTGHAFVVLGDSVYDNNGVALLEQYKIPKPSDYGERARKRGWESAIFLFTLREKPWGETQIVEFDTSHEFYFELTNFQRVDLWTISGMETLDRGGWIVVFPPELKKVAKRIAKEMSSSQ
ncbi:MAG: hypothetical protein QXY05_04275 [Candidatus Anstonellales archaeon]